MNSPAELEHCLNFINTQLRNGKRPNASLEPGHIRAVTISRQAGCGAAMIAHRLAERLQEYAPIEGPKWTVFDKELIEQVLREHNLPQRMAKYLPENWTSEIQDTIDELFGIHPSSWLFVRQTAETILRLAKLGNVILIGRGANVVTAKLEGVFHVRLVAPIENRVARIKASGQTHKATLEFIHQEDRGRQRYLRKHYHKDIEDPLLYHMVLNTDLIGCDGATEVIEHAVMIKNRESLVCVRAA